MKISLSLLLWGWACSLAAQSFDTTKLDQYLAGLEANNKAMLSLAIVEQGKTVYQKSIGFADIENQQKANQDTQYRIGSISKVYTATMIFQLIDEGKLSLDTTLDKYYPNITNAQQITISMLLSHRSGIQNFTSAPEYPSYMAKPKSKAEMLKIFDDLDSDFTPVSNAKYSNTGYVLLGYIVEDISKDSYANQLQQRIASRLNLAKTMYGGPINPKVNQAASYMRQKNQWADAAVTDMSIPHGAGAIISTPNEVALFFAGLFSGKLISAESLANMKEINQGFGRGLFQFPFYDRRAYGHNGGIDGFSSNAAIFTDDNVVFALTANGMNYPMNDINIAILSIYFGRPYDIPDFAQKAIKLPKEQLQKYQGVFASQAIPLKITLKVKNDQLTAQATGQQAFILESFSMRDFRFEQAGIVLLFEPDGEGVDYSTFYLKQGGGNFKFTKE